MRLFFEPLFWQPFFGNTARSVVVTVYKQGNCGALTAKIAKILLFFQGPMVNSSSLYPLLCALCVLCELNPTRQS
jgi:hypothetical protein